MCKLCTDRKSALCFGSLQHLALIFYLFFFSQHFILLSHAEQQGYISVLIVPSSLKVFFCYEPKQLSKFSDCAKICIRRGNGYCFSSRTSVSCIASNWSVRHTTWYSTGTMAVDFPWQQIVKGVNAFAYLLQSNLIT